MSSHREPHFLAILLLFMPTAFDVASGATYRNIEYSQVSGSSLYMDVQTPDAPGTFPAAIIVHGGGWVRGDRRIDVAPLFQPLTDARIAWFSIDYRLSGDITQFGAAIQDIQNAIRFIKDHAAEYRVDPNRIALIGESAGGQLAAMAALRPAPGARVKGVIAMYAPMDLVELAQTSTFIPKQIRDSFRDTPFEQLILARLKQLSPIENVGPDSPPFLLIHGTEDRLVPFAQSRDMCARMQASGSSCEMFSVPGAGHGMRWWEQSQVGAFVSYKRVITGWLTQLFAIL